MTEKGKDTFVKKPDAKEKVQEHEGFQAQIVDRYNKEASACCSNLSCGQPLTYLNPQAGEVLLDIGFGMGLEMMRAAQAVGATGKVYGIDLSPLMLESASASAEELGIDNCEFMIGDAQNIPLSNDTVTGVFSNCVINHAEDKKQVYKEIHRVMKPGARFVIADIYAQKELPDEIKNDPEMWAQCIGGAITKQKYIKAVEEAGFHDITINKEELSRKKAKYGIFSFTISAVK